MKHKAFTVTFFVGFKKVGSSRVVTSNPDGLTIEEMTEYCKDKFPGRIIKVEA